ncbi:MAG: hypothetical protein E6G68_02450 [Actinobacteria bacterium]|nr:MAG: hypothetical protein E6G68_02450 [Actinomycetota bacterium]
MNPYLTQQLAAGRMADAHRRAEKARLAGTIAATGGRTFPVVALRGGIAARLGRLVRRVPAPSRSVEAC